jgi:Domain of unknown function (DUF1906)/Domain of unknown function (DUF4214)
MAIFRFTSKLLLTAAVLATSATQISAREAVIADAPFSSMQALNASSFIGVAQGRLVKWSRETTARIDVTPIGASDIAHAHFIDGTRGWAVQVPMQGEIGTRVWRTADGGSNWLQSAVAIDGDVSSLKVHFADQKNGWLIARLPSSSNFSFARLFATNDGGTSWRELTRPPIAGELRMSSTGQGWLLGGADGRSLFATRDHGASWSAVNVPLMIDAHKSFQLALPIVHTNARTRGEAILPALETTEINGRIEQQLLEFSIDATSGAVRELGRHAVTLGENAPVPARLVGSEKSLALAGDVKSLLRSGDARLQVLIDKSGTLQSISESSNDRWYVFADGACAAKSNCVSEQKVAQAGFDRAAIYGQFLNAQTYFITSNALDELGAVGAGKANEKRVVQSTRRGFDACSAPSVATLNTWFTASPYRGVNFYMGGRNRACSQPQLTSSWITQNLATGWYLIPTWVGYQSPTTICTGCAKFSTNATTARSQGVDEANLAANAAEALGLTKPNMIYFNLELYNTETAAEPAFVDGFSAQLKARGYVPGLYVHVANVASFASIANPPEGVWVARWSGSGGSGPSTIPDPNRITGMSDTIFVNKRVWQHYGDFNTTWGGITIGIDANVSNGPLVGRDLTAQTITFGTLVDRDISVGSVAVSATANSGLAVSFASLTSGACTVSGGTVSLLATGTCTIRASQAGNATYAAAPNVDRSFQITASGPRAQTISFAALPTRVIGLQGFDLSATASSGLMVSYTSLTTSVCTVTDWRVAVLAVGTCTIRASQAGNANFQAAANVDQSFSIIAVSACSTATTTGDCDSDGIPNGVEASVSKSATVKDNDVFASDKLFIMQQYRDMLRKEADTSAQNYWLNEFAAGRHTRASMIEYLYGHNDYGVPASKVIRLYLASFDRTPDFSGLFYWMDQLKTKTLADVANSLVSSAEFRAMRGTLDDTAYVQFVFNTTLGRAATASEVSTWTADLAAQRTTRGAMLAQFTEGSTFVAAARSEVLVTLTYVGMLQRRPDNSGYAYWVGRIDSGVTAQSMISGFLSSTEYRKRFLP